MNQEQSAKWEKYCLAEKDRIRSVLNTELEQFISHLLTSEAKEYENWVFDLSEKVIDCESGFPIRMPLFEKVILPVLLKGCKKKVSGCARWLAGFNQLVYKSKIAQDTLGSEYSEISFLKLALDHDPSDLLAKRRLAAAIAWQLDYAIHEVPGGVLWDNDGASIKQCEELNKDLSAFKVLVFEIGEREKFQELIKECSLHFSEYPKYLADKDKYGSYKEYLFTHNKLHNIGGI